MILNYLKNHYKKSISYILFVFFSVKIFELIYISSLKSGEVIFFTWIFSLWFSQFIRIGILSTPIIFIFCLITFYIQIIFISDIYAAGGISWTQNTFIDNVISLVFTTFFFTSPILVNYGLEKIIYFFKFFVNRYAIFDQLF